MSGDTIRCEVGEINVINNILNCIGYNNVPLNGRTILFYAEENAPINVVNSSCGFVLSHSSLAKPFYVVNSTVEFLVTGTASMSGYASPAITCTSSSISFAPRQNPVDYASSLQIQGATGFPAIAAGADGECEAVVFGALRDWYKIQGGGDAPAISASGGSSGFNSVVFKQGDFELEGSILNVSSLTFGDSSLAPDLSPRLRVWSVRSGVTLVGRTVVDFVASAELWYESNSPRFFADGVTFNSLPVMMDVRYRKNVGASEREPLPASFPFLHFSSLALEQQPSVYCQLTTATSQESFLYGDRDYDAIGHSVPNGEYSIMAVPTDSDDHRVWKLTHDADLTVFSVSGYSFFGSVVANLIQATPLPIQVPTGSATHAGSATPLGSQTPVQSSEIPAGPENECNLQSGPLVVSGTEAFCGTKPISLATYVNVTGASTEHGITVANASHLDLRLFSVNLDFTERSPITIQGGTVSLTFAGENQLSAKTTFAGIACGGNATVDFNSGEGILYITVEDGPGIGPVAGERCGSLKFNGGTYEIASMGHGAGIGTGAAQSGSSATLLESIEIAGGHFRISQTGGTGIGAGAALTAGESRVGAVTIIFGVFSIYTAAGGVGIGASQSGAGGLSQVNSIVIQGGKYNISSGPLAWGGAGIGSGYVTAGGRSVVTALQILNGDFDLNLAGGASCLGAGFATGSGSVSIVNRLEITTGKFNASTANGAAVGSGPSQSNALSSVHELIIRYGLFNLTTANAAGIGTGFAQRANSTVDRLAIDDGKFTIVVGFTNKGPGAETEALITSYAGGAGIGSGFAWGSGGSAPYYEGNTAIRSLTISDGSYDITTVRGAAIGAAPTLATEQSVSGTVMIVPATSNVHNMTLVKGKFKLLAINGTGIGAALGVLLMNNYPTAPVEGSLATVELLNIREGDYKITAQSGIGSTTTATVTTLNLGSPKKQVKIDANIQRPTTFSAINLVSDGGVVIAGTNAMQFIQYGAYTTQSLAPLTFQGFFTGDSGTESLRGSELLHFKSIAFQPSNSSEHVFVVYPAGNLTVVQTVGFNASRYQGMVISVPREIHGSDFEVSVDGVYVLAHLDNGTNSSVFHSVGGDAVFASVVVLPRHTLPPGQTPYATLSRSPFPTPIPLNISGGEVDVSDLLLDDGSPVQLVGDGTITGSGTVPILYLAPAAVVLAENITIESYLELSDNSVFSATSTGTVQLKEEVSLLFASQTAVESLPRLDLGLIGGNYRITPKEFVVDIGSIEKVEDNLTVPLVQGRTLTNCDDWQKIISFRGAGSHKLSTECREGKDGQLLADPLRTLYVVKKHEDGGPTTPSDDGGNEALIGGVVAAVVVVVAAVVIGVVVKVKKGGGSSGSASSARA